MKLSEHISYSEFINTYPTQVANAEDFIFKKYVIQFVDIKAGLFYLNGADPNEEGLATYEELLDMISAGAISSISSAILSVSSPHSLEELEHHLNIARYTQEQDLIGIILSLLSTTYHLDIDTLKKEKTWNELLSMFAQAEMVLTGRVPELPLQLDKS